MHREYDPAQMGLDGVARSRDHSHHLGDDQSHAAAHRRLVATTALVGALLAAHLLLPIWAPAYARPFGVPLGLLAALIGGSRVVYLALAALFEGRIGADIALALATVAAAALGEYFVAAEVVFIALLGECLEAYTFDRAQRAIGKLLDLRPRTARVLRDGVEVEVPADALAVGDVLIVRPGERIAADGMVLAGRSAVDQSALTGEGLPVDKGPGEPVYTGTVNAFGRLEVRAEATGTETTLGQVIRLLAEAQARKSPLERTADRYARLFLPAVLVAAVVVFGLTNLAALSVLVRSGSLDGARLDMMPTLAVLVVACPCALVLATPAAILAATARLARRGVLVKGGAAIERLAAVDCLAFDKTGTLTEGRPELGDRVALGGMDEDALLRLAAAAEHPSEHPLATLLVAEARRRSMVLPAAEDFRAHPGAGVRARVEGHAVLVGNPRLFREQGVALTVEAERALEGLDISGQTALLVAIDGGLVGVLGARDRLRPEAHGVIHDLKHLGLTDLALLTGDRPAPARAVAGRVHIDEVQAEQTPAGKADWVRRKQDEGRIVAMIGDGINDAPALALADVGIALGGVGTDIAAEAGSVILMGDPLRPLPGAIALSRRTVRIIRQGILLFAFGLNSLAIVLAGLRLLGPVAAAILHQIGSLLVILNAMRLLGTEGFEQFGVIRRGRRALAVCQGCRPEVVGDWIVRHRRAVLGGLMAVGLLAFVLSGVRTIEPGEVGVLRRWGRYRAILGPGLHLRLPAPAESITVIEPDRVRVARVGLSESAQNERGSIAWNASHGAQRDDSALFLTGDEGLVELAGVVEYRYGRSAMAGLLFGVAALNPAAESDPAVQAAAEASFREVVSHTPLESLLVGGRTAFEQDVRRDLSRRLVAAGLPVTIDQVRILDAHPPREIVPAYRDVAAAEADAARYQNEAQGYADEQRWIAAAEAQALRNAAATEAHRMEARAGGERDAFLARQRMHAAHPELTEFRLLWAAFADHLAGRSKLILDPHAASRHRVWLADPDRFGLGPAALASPTADAGRLEYPHD